MFYDNAIKQLSQRWVLFNVKQFPLRWRFTCYLFSDWHNEIKSRLSKLAILMKSDSLTDHFQISYLNVMSFPMLWELPSEGRIRGFILHFRHVVNYKHINVLYNGIRARHKWPQLLYIFCFIDMWELTFIVWFTVSSVG
jgi:hypothetical protein